jgi:hypothetical protein
MIPKACESKPVLPRSINTLYENMLWCLGDRLPWECDVLSIKIDYNRLAIRSTCSGAHDGEIKAGAMVIPIYICGMRMSEVHNEIMRRLSGKIKLLFSTLKSLKFLPALGNICIDGIGILSKGEEPPSFPKGAV